MKTEGSKIIGLLFSLILAVGSVFAFLWVWTQISKDASTAGLSSSKYMPIEINSVKTEAEEILADKEKISSDIPIQLNTSKMGRDNPFAAP